MPAPSQGVVKTAAMTALPMTQNPQVGQKLAAAMSQVVAPACEVFVSRVFVEPGVPCTVTPPANAGFVSGVGRLSGSCPSEGEIKANAISAISRAGMSKHGQDRFVATMTKLTAVGLAEFMKLAQILPGTVIAGGITASPGRLTVPTQAIKSQLDVMAMQMAPAPGAGATVSELPSDFPKIVAKVLGSTLELMIQMVMVSPGIPVGGNLTVGPGKLM